LPISNQISHNDNNYHVVFLGGPNAHTTNLKWLTAAILKKIEKSPHLGNGLTDRHGIWYVDAM